MKTDCYRFLAAVGLIAAIWAFRLLIPIVRIPLRRIRFARRKPGAPTCSCQGTSTSLFQYRPPALGTVVAHRRFADRVTFGRMH